MEINIGGVSNTALTNATGSITSQKTMVSGPVPHQAAKKALIQQARETVTRSWPSLRTSIMFFCSSNTKLIPKPSCTSSSYIPMEKIRPGTGSWRLTQLSKCTPKFTNSTPTTSNKSYSLGNPQVGPQEHFTWHNEEPPNDLFTHPQLNLVHYTNHHSTHLALHTVRHQDNIHTRYLDNQFP